MRVLTRVLMIAALLLIAAPFFLSWRYIDERGVEISGRVTSKREFVVVRHSDWERKCEVMVSYKPLDELAGAYVVSDIDPEHFDRLRQDGPATVRYLRSKDIPAVPFAQQLRSMGLLPKAKVAGQVGIRPAAWRWAGWIAAGIALLAVWRFLRFPAFPVAVVAGVAGLAAAILYTTFPRPVPEPRTAVRTASGRVASVRRIGFLFSGSRSRGMEAAQPIQVVGVPFVPAGAVEPVLAVDLIDEDSIPGLKEGGTATVVYEQAAPRIARIAGGTRTFAERNANGAMMTAGLGAAAFIGVLLVLSLIGRAFKGIARRLV